uniref:Insulin-related peptide 4 n=1 Tax=Nilaparvata lugens TaxID=108931 RepID=U3U7D3_NILLU|nr:insulin-related peptide 4 [Nilaparvata lugens]
MLFSAALAISCFLPNSHALPHELELRRCGEGLANMMALVCKGRGYNSFFPDPSSGRIRRGIGIVDECCRSSCSLSTVLQYCGPLTSTEAPTDTVIKKRSDSDTDWAVETNSEGVEMLTYKPRTLQTDNEKLPKTYYGVKASEQRQTFEEISNSIQKLSSSTPTSSSSSSS